MDRFVFREPRAGAEYPQGNQVIAFPTNTTPGTSGNSIMQQRNEMYFNPIYGSEMNGMQRANNAAFITSIPANNNYLPQNMAPRSSQNQVISGIDPSYLAAFSGNPFTTTGLQTHPDRTVMMSPQIGAEFMNNTLTGPDRTNTRMFSHRVNETPRVEEARLKAKQCANNPLKPPSDHLPHTANAVTKVAKQGSFKTEVQTPGQTRFDKIKALQKSGTRVFSGPVEKVLKWHKILQDIGVMVLYEVVAKCLNVKPGESCSKNLLIRDDNGPAMQVVYYEIDFLLPELKPPCTVRIVGRMLPGTCRLQAYSVRIATGDDVATQSRRAAVAAHHVAKICKEYGCLDKI